MADSIQAGSYSVREVFQRAGFDFEGHAAADYLGGQPDFRRVKVGGLSFDDLDDRIRIPVTADTVELTVDGRVVQTLDVDLNDEQRELRAYSFATAVDVAEEHREEADAFFTERVDSRFRDVSEVERTDV